MNINGIILIPSGVEQITLLLLGYGGGPFLWCFLKK